MNANNPKNPVPQIRFNGGIGAILCNKCGVIIKTNLTRDEFQAKTDILFCDKCLKELGTLNDNKPET